MNDAEHKDYMKRLNATEINAECANIVKYVNQIAHWMKECVGYVPDDNPYFKDGKLRPEGLDLFLFHAKGHTREDLYKIENASAMVISGLFCYFWKDEHKAHQWLMFYCLTSPYRSVIR